MNHREIKFRAGALIFSTRPHPYFAAVVYAVILEAISLIASQVGGQPFVLDAEAAAAGDYANAIIFTPENVSTKAALIIMTLEVLSVIIWYGFQSFCLHAARGEKTSFYALMDGFFVLFRAFFIWLFTGLAIWFGSMLFIVPGLFLWCTYAMAPILLLDHPDWGFIRCLRESRKLMRGHKWRYFVLRMSMLLWKIATMFPITSVFAFPYITLSDTVFYLDLIGDDAVKPIEQPPANNQKPPWEY